MNLVIDDAVEVKQVTKTNPEEKRRQLGRTLADGVLALWPNFCMQRLTTSCTGQILLKGDNVSLIQEAV